FGDITTQGVLLGFVFAGLVLIGGGLTALGLIAQAELFDLFIALEENTRATRRLMEAERREAVAPPVFTPSLTPRPAPPPAPGAPLPPTTP
ncbi:MAG: hypothetical protein RMM31_09765, partial [Anaerolineae bacterium]|nr:hypothetical protein [Anaerolineae bacterium]